MYNLAFYLCPFILSCKDPRGVCLAQGADEGALPVQTKAAGIVPLAVFSPKRTLERKCCHCSDASSALLSTALHLVRCTGEVAVFGTTPVQVQVWYLVHNLTILPKIGVHYKH